eukprot:358675-Chlamydomonas_euryale.AAC.1
MSVKSAVPYPVDHPASSQRHQPCNLYSAHTVLHAAAPRTTVILSHTGADVQLRLSCQGATCDMRLGSAAAWKFSAGLRSCWPHRSFCRPGSRPYMRGRPRSSQPGAHSAADHSPLCTGQRRTPAEGRVAHSGALATHSGVPVPAESALHRGQPSALRPAAMRASGGGGQLGHWVVARRQLPGGPGWPLHGCGGRSPLASGHQPGLVRSAAEVRQHLLLLEVVGVVAKLQSNRHTPWASAGKRPNQQAISTNTCHAIARRTPVLRLYLKIRSRNSA